jgi:hypothetical protein
MVVCYAIAELSDLLDGKIARKYNLVTDLGKVLDPFADTLSHLTFFVCFFGYGIMPAWTFIIIMWREFGILFLRMLMMKTGKAMPANIFGKSKTVCRQVRKVGGVGKKSSDATCCKEGIICVNREGLALLFTNRAKTGVVVKQKVCHCAVFNQCDIFTLQRPLKQNRGDGLTGNVLVEKNARFGVGTLLSIGKLTVSFVEVYPEGKQLVYHRAALLYHFGDGFGVVFKMSCSKGVLIEGVEIVFVSFNTNSALRKLRITFLCGTFGYDGHIFVSGQTECGIKSRNPTAYN